MELINNIWIALSTPNELYTKLFSLPLAFVEFYLFMKFFLIVLGISSSSKKQTLYVFGSAIISVLSNLFVPTPYNIFLNYILLFIITKLIFNLTAFKALIGIAISFITSGIISVLVLNPFLTLFHISSEILTKTPIYTIIYSLVIYFILFLIICIIKHSNFKIALFNDITKKNKKIIIVNFIFAIITLSIQVFVDAYNIDTTPIFITFLSFLSLLAYLGISIFSLTKTVKLNETTKKLQTAEE